VAASSKRWRAAGAPDDRNQAFDSAAARRAVVAVVARIPHGCLASYGQVAYEAGFPGRARWVGRVLSESLAQHPGWHRVIRNDGALGLPKSSPAHAEQRALLVAEGHRFSADRLDMAAHRWRPRGDAPLVD
jgi:methylated-DNA-protein-cysteine methyltransferase related protein